jgi:hypothetical protein
VTVLAVEFGSETRYYWNCPRCTYVSLPFKDQQRAAAEHAVHWACRFAR